jgi:hypothetical protein
MLHRAILLLAFIVFLSANIGRADIPPNLPSQKASVVLPLLRKIKIGDDMSKVRHILGDNLQPNTSGVGQIQWYCTLDDGSVVHVDERFMPTGHVIGSIDVVSGTRKTTSSTPGPAK